MADISKCTGQDCPLKEECYRYLAPNNEFRQSYFTTPPFETNKCEYLWKIEKK